MKKVNELLLSAPKPTIKELAELVIWAGYKLPSPKIKEGQFDFKKKKRNRKIIA